MKRIKWIPVILLFLVLGSCNDFGKSVKIEGTKAEVFYKGGATAADAKKVGDFLKSTGFISNDKAASIQVVKESDGYTIRFVYNKDYYEKNKELDSFFKGYGATISKEVLNGEKVNIALSDKQFKDYKNIPFDASAQSETATGLAPAAPPAGPMSTDEFDHEARGDVNFYWKGIPDTESKTIIDYIAENGAFNGGTANLYITKANDRYLIQFPVKESYRDNADIIAEVEKVSKQIKENVFANSAFTFQMTDEQLNAVKSFDY